MEYNLNRNIISTLKGAIRKVSNYVEGDEPNQEIISDAYESFIKLLKHLEYNKGIRLFKKVWRQRTFEESSKAYVTVGTNYRCIKGHDVPNITTWSLHTEYEEGDTVYPSTYNGYYYEALNDGLSGSSQPSLLSVQDAEIIDETENNTWTALTTYSENDVVVPTVANGYFFKCTQAGDSSDVEPNWFDNDEEGDPLITDGTVVWQRFKNITWIAVPDTKPGVGKNFSTYWFLDDSIDDSDASLYAINSTYRCSADFDLKDDELYVSQAHIRHANYDRYPISIISSEEYTDIGYKWHKSIPDSMYIENKGLYDKTAHLHPMPSLVGENGYILHYEVVLKTSVTDNETDNMEYVDGWFLYLEFALAANLAPEYGVELQDKVYLDRKADNLLKECKRSDNKKVTQRRIRSCY